MVHLVGVLLLVEAVGGGLPDVDFGGGQGFAGAGALDDAVHEGDFAVGGRVEGDGAAVGAGGGVVAEEGAEDGGGGGELGCVAGLLICDLVDKAAKFMRNRILSPRRLCVSYSRFQTQHITHQLDFVATVVAHLTGPDEHLHSFHAFVPGHIILATEIVRVSD